MKQICIYLAIISIISISCNNKKTSERQTSKGSTTAPEKKPALIEEAKKEIIKGKEELQNLQPKSLEQLKALIPEILMGAKRTGFDASISNGAGNATAEYELNDSTTLSLSFYDCGGPAGAGIYELQYGGMINAESNDAGEYTKTINYGDDKAFEHCEKATNDCTITWMAGGRYLVTLAGENIGAEALKKAGKELRF